MGGRGFLIAACAGLLPAVGAADTLLLSLEKAERALFCQEGVRENRVSLLALAGDIDRGRRMPKGFADGLVDEGAIDLARALFLKHVGTLYGFPNYAAKGRSQAEAIAVRRGAIRFRDEADLPDEVKRHYALMEESRADLTNSVRRGGVDGRPFWNGRSRIFIYPPAFAFKPQPGAVRYRFRVTDDLLDEHAFEADKPTAPLTPVWAALPVGFARVVCDGIDERGRTLGRVGERRFWRGAPFDPSELKPAKRTYEEALRLVGDYLFRWPSLDVLEREGRPNIAEGSNFTSYPSKMQSQVIEVMLTAARTNLAQRERALRLARISADYLLSTRQPAGTPLEGFTATYVGKGQLSGTYGGQHMLVYPASAGRALISLYRETGERKYLEAAETIAQTYLRLQGADGTWPLKMYEKDGQPVTPNRLIPNDVIDFLERLHTVTGDVRFREAADRAFAFIDRGPLADWNWAGQFEDIRPEENRYANLTKHDACDVAMYLLRRFPGDAKRRSEARELLRFAEDQFVMWRAPCRPDGTGPWKPIYPFFSWRTPAVLEQYSCYLPIDASAAKLIRTYLALYAAEGHALDLAKARALGDAMVNNQDESGRIRTYWIPEAGDTGDPLAGVVPSPLGGDWYNCMAEDMQALAELVGTFPNGVQKGTTR